jgi:hypothetical protein
MLKKVLIGIIVIVVVALIAAKFMPTKFGYEDSVEISATPAQVWQHTNSIRSMDTWSPWVAMDPDSKITFEGEDGVLMSKGCWDSEMEDVGKGCQWITDIEENKHMGTEMLFVRPNPGPADAYVDLEALEGGTKVTWGFKSEVPWPWNLSLLGMDLKAKMGKPWSDGLNNLKALSEASAKADAEREAMEADAAESEEVAAE